MIFRKLSRHVLLSWPFLLIFSPINKFSRLWEKNPRLKPESSGKLQPVYHQASGLSTEDPLREFKRYNCLQDKIQWILEGKYKALQGDRTKWIKYWGVLKETMRRHSIRKHRKPPDFDLHFLSHLKRRNTQGWCMLVHIFSNALGTSHFLYSWQNVLFWVAWAFYG